MTLQQQQRAQEMASVQLQQLQASLQLKTNQLDKVFAVLAKQVEAHLSHLETNTLVVLNDRNQFDQNIESFRDGLTPAQFKRYQKLQAQQSQSDQSFLQWFLQAIGPAATGLNFRGWR